MPYFRNIVKAWVEVLSKRLPPIFYSNIENLVLWARSEKKGYAQKLNSKLNSKHEARNPEQIQNPNVQMTKTNTALPKLSDFLRRNVPRS